MLNWHPERLAGLMFLMSCVISGSPLIYKQVAIYTSVCLLLQGDFVKHLQ